MVEARDTTTRPRSFFHRDSFDAPATFAQKPAHSPPMIRARWVAQGQCYHATRSSDYRLCALAGLCNVCVKDRRWRIGGSRAMRCLRMRRGGQCTGVRRHGRATFARHCTGFRVSGPFYRESRGAFGVHPRLKRSFFT